MVTDFGTNRQPVYHFLLVILYRTVSKLSRSIGQIFALETGYLSLKLSRSIGQIFALETGYLSLRHYFLIIPENIIVSHISSKLDIGLAIVILTHLAAKSTALGKLATGA